MRAMANALKGRGVTMDMHKALCALAKSDEVVYQYWTMWSNDFS